MFFFGKGKKKLDPRNKIDEEMENEVDMKSCRRCVGEHAIRADGGTWNTRMRDTRLRWGVAAAAFAALVVVAANDRSRSERTTLGESALASSHIESLAQHNSVGADQHAAKMAALHRVAVTQHPAALHRVAFTHMLDVVATDDNNTNATGFTGGENGTCRQPPKLHAYYVNALFWVWVHTLEVSGVSVDADGKETTIPLGHVYSEPFSFISKASWKDPNGNVIAVSHQVRYPYKGHK